MSKNRKYPTLKATWNSILLLATVLLLTSFASPVKCDQNQSAFDMSLDKLMSIKVTSVTRTLNQELFDSPASLYVITNEDMRRSGLLHIPEILRLAPALQVGRMDAGSWAISARGFNNRYNRLQLVQMDGRSLTNPLFGGVYWASQDYVIDDLDRIEVISGPGSTLWGSNAVNGVISIVSKPAKETQGWLIKAHTGTKERGIGTIRYGDRLGDNSYYRFYLKHSEHGKFDTYSFNDAHYTSPYVNEYTISKSDDLYSYEDSFRRRRAGFRADWENGDTDSFTLQADYYSLLQGDSVAYATYTIVADPLGARPLNVASDKESDGWNILGRWSRIFSPDSRMQLQMYIDWSSQEYLNPLTPFSDKRRVSEIDFQHNLKIGGGHDVVWGATYRRNLVSVHSNIMTFSPNSETNNSDVLSGFFQDSFPFFSRKLEMTVGSKVERNDFTGGETQPCARLTWKPNDANVVWAAVSKAVKVPGYETEARLTVGGADVPANSFGAGNPPVDLWMPFSLIGNPLVSEEEVVAYELGYRVKPNAELSLDFTLFTNRGHHMQRTTTVSSVPPVVQLVSTGVMHYEGVEFTANWIISDHWRLVGGYTWFDAEEKATVPITVGDETPKNQAQLRSYLDAGDRFEINAAVYYKDNINHEDSLVPRSIRVDLGFTWKDTARGAEWRFWGQNLFDPQHRESAPDRYSSLGAAEVERAFYTELLLRY